MRYRWILSQAAAVNGMYVRVYAKGYRGSGHLSLVLYVRNLKSLRLGWKRRANYCFVLLNQSGKELLRSPGWGVLTTLPLTTLQNVIPKYQGVKTAHMNLLLGLIETLRKSPQSFSVTELSHAQSELTELTDAAFKLDWLKSKLEEVPLERKKALSDGSWVQQLEERVKNVELALCDLKVELEKE